METHCFELVAGAVSHWTTKPTISTETKKGIVGIIVLNVTQAFRKARLPVLV